MPLDKGLWALGDCAVVEGCAPTAQAASQQGSYLGRLFRDNLKYFDRELYNSRSPTTLDQAAELIPPSVDHFKYVDQGALAYVGGNQGVAELKNLIWVGYPYFRYPLIEHVYHAQWVIDLCDQSTVGRRKWNRLCQRPFSRTYSSR